MRILAWMSRFALAIVQTVSGALALYISLALLKLFYQRLLALGWVWQ